MAGGRSATASGPRVQISVNDLEKVTTVKLSQVKLMSSENPFQDWDVSSDPELQKVLNVARLLGRTAPAPPKVVSRVPMFNLLPTQIR